MDKQSKIQWCDSYSIGIPIIDEQHKEWIILLNKISKTSSDKLTKMIDTVIRFSRFHFKYEESLFILFGYELEDDHEEVHKNFLHQLDLLRNKSTENSILPTEVALKIFIWLKEHVLIEDKKYAPLLIGGGINSKSSLTGISS